MHNTVRTQLPDWTRITATENFLSFCQQDLLLAKYIMNFGELRDVFTTQNGKGFNNIYVIENTQGYKNFTENEKFATKQEA